MTSVLQCRTPPDLEPQVQPVRPSSEDNGTKSRVWPVPGPVSRSPRFRDPARQRARRGHPARSCTRADTDQVSGGSSESTTMAGVTPANVTELVGPAAVDPDVMVPNDHRQLWKQSSLLGNGYGFIA